MRTCCPLYAARRQQSDDYFEGCLDKLAKECQSAIALTAAQKQFAVLDVNNNGFLDGEELKQMVDWVWQLFHPGSAPLAEEQREAMGKSLVLKVDKDSDGKLTMKEFEPWFGELQKKMPGLGK